MKLNKIIDHLKGNVEYIATVYHSEKSQYSSLWSRVFKYLKENDKFGGILFNITHVPNIFKFYFIMEISIKTPIKIKRILTNKTCNK